MVFQIRKIELLKYTHKEGLNTMQREQKARGDLIQNTTGKNISF